MQIIALSGKAGTGKDYLYTHFFQPERFYRVALADHFKTWIIGKGLATYEEVHVTKPPHVRKLLQEEGTERGRDAYGVDIWCRTLGAWMRHWETTWNMSRFVVTDVRFPNEVDYIKSLGGAVYRIVAPLRADKSSLSAEAKVHISETALDGFDDFSGKIYNDVADMATLPAQINALMIQSGFRVADSGNPFDMQFGV